MAIVQRAASGGPDKAVRIWDVESGREQITLTGFAGWATCLAYSPRGNVLAALCAGAVNLRDAKSGAVLDTLRPKGGTANALAIDPSGHSVALAGADGAVTIWSLASGRLEKSYPLVPGTDPNQLNILALAWSPEGRHLAVALANGSIYLLRPEHPTAPPAGPR